MYGLEDLYKLAEILAVDSYNKALLAKKAEK